MKTGPVKSVFLRECLNTQKCWPETISHLSLEVSTFVSLALSKKVRFLFLVKNVESMFRACASENLE